MRAWILYSVVRLLLFAVPFGILFAIGAEWWLAALIATALAFCVSYIFLKPLREGVTTQLAARASGKAAPPTSDEEAEDAPRP